ncbi:hypothetical protein [Micromonospora lupini]|uniref:Uncharacterized protein n=1 Tax=Micromonospora lupini str. Lupac 08 TaxID=1150864 RepID=I0L1N4_9ACTN|nr:hypothetical protein [Micromonospora lupini]CCH17731.1 hypothetical protein MILUP08_42662 [Micromonospora lupini str. Lupac 08]
MTETVQLLDDQNRATPEGREPEIGPAATDPMLHAAVTEEMLAAAWQATHGSEDAPPWLNRVAILLAAGYGPMPATPTDEMAHHLLTVAVAAANATAEAAVVEANARQLAHDEFSNDVRRRAARAVNNREICLSGTNYALERLGITTLPVEYSVELLVPVTVRVRATDEENAYDRAADELRSMLHGGDLDFDEYDLRREGAQVSDEDIDLDDLD